MILAQQLDSGTIRYITLKSYERESVTSLLKTFYSKAERVAALFELGNIVALQGSPFGKYKFNGDDNTNCIASIRDHRESRGKNIAKYGTLAELAGMEQLTLIYNSGVWQYLDKDGSLSELPQIIPPAKRDAMIGLEFRTFSDKDEITSIWGKTFKSERSENPLDETGKPIFVFRGNKLITTINHPKR